MEIYCPKCGEWTIWNLIGYIAPDSEYRFCCKNCETKFILSVTFREIEGENNE